MDRLEEVAAKALAVDLWRNLVPYNWAVKPLGTAIPYFCSIYQADGRPDTLMMLEGWQTLHDFTRTRMDNSFGFHSAMQELPHFAFDLTGAREMRFVRFDPGYAPMPVPEARHALLAKILWQTYGLLLRSESDPKLPMMFADEGAMFARVETADGVWEDRPLVIPNPPPHVEKVQLPKKHLSAAKDLPLAAREKLAIDFRLRPDLVTNEPRQRAVYQLIMVNRVDGKAVFDAQVSLVKGQTLRSMWEEMPTQVLMALIRHGTIPAEVEVCSPRVFRMLRPLCVELPFKLTLDVAMPKI